MTYFSRCETPQALDRTLRAPTRRRIRHTDEAPQRALSGFFEDMGILIRYAAGLDYYNRKRLLRKD